MHPKPGRSSLRAILSLSVIATLVAAGVALFAAPANALVPMKRAYESATVTGGQCEAYTWSPLTVTIDATYPEAPYNIVVSSGGVTVDFATVIGDNGSISAAFALPPGDYLVEVTRMEHRGDNGDFVVSIPASVLACADLGIAVMPQHCSIGRDGEALLTLSGLISGIVTYSVTGPDFAVGGSLDEFGPTEQIELVGLPPGNYTAYVEWHPFPGAEGEEAPVAPAVYDWVGFAIEPCQPIATVEPVQCTASGGTGSAVATLTELVEGVEYAVRVTDPGIPDGEPYGVPQLVTGDASGEAGVDLGSLPAGHGFTVWVDGVWEAGPWEEPPWLGNGGNFVPLESLALTTSADFSLSACPAAPATASPATPASKPALPATGPELGGGLLAAFALLGLGATAMLARRRAAPTR